MPKSIAKKKTGHSSISVVLPVFNMAESVGKTIELILSQSVSPDEVIVVDDGSTDSSADVIRAYPVRYIYQKNAGPAAARNAGWKAARGAIVAFTDADCLPDKEWLKFLTAPFLQKRVGAVGGAYRTANVDKLLPRLIGYDLDFRYSLIGKFTNAHGSYNLAVRRNVLHKVGGFNESYPVPTAEDWDLCLKIVSAGYQIRFNRRAIVAGFHREDLRRYFKDQYRHGFYRMLLYQDHPEGMRGDAYSGSAGIQAVFGLLLIGGGLLLLVSLFVGPPLFRLSLELEIGLLFMLVWFHRREYMFIVRRQGRIVAMNVVALQIFRNIAWGWGALRGLVHFHSLPAILKLH